MCSDAPDNSGINAAAQANAALSKESLDWYKQIYAEQAPARDAAAARANTVSDAQLMTMQQNNALSKDYADYQANTYRPLEKAMVADAQNYDTSARREQKAGEAMADVTQQFSSARDQNSRAMSRMGVNPSSGRALAMGNQTAIAQASAMARAGSKARDSVEMQGYARKMDAANLGRGLASNQATSAGVAMNAGNSSVNNAGIPLTQANAAASMMGQGFSTAISGNNSAGQLYAQAAQNQGSDNGIMGAIGGIAGQFAGSKAGSEMIGKGISWLAASDKTKKKNVKPVTDGQALKAIEKTPVSTWDYKPGVGDGGNHTGPMAQTVQKNMGDQAGPSGKAIDLITLNGQNMAAIAALSRKVDKLAKAKGAAA